MTPTDNAGIPRTPILDGDFWRIGSNPDLGELHGDDQEIVDHAIWQSADGMWHLWACIRGTAVGRVIYGWDGELLEQTNWREVGVTLRADRDYGESVNDWQGEEWIQAPHVISVNDVYMMFYGVHNTELGECQICLATSADGRSFQRHSDDQGYSRLFVGPGEARDPMVIRVGDEYLCYYAGHDTGRREPGKIYCRTSTDLIHWSDHRQVSYGGHSSGGGFWSAECPFVVEVDGYFYLFRTSEYASPARTHVYRSKDPFDFGLGTDRCWITTLRVAAPEIVQAGDQYYISSVEDLQGGVQLAKLKWT